MKSKIILSMLMVVLAFSCNRIGKEERVLNVGEKDAVVVIKTPKARCHNCQSIIEAGLNATKGVKQTILNLNKREVSIVYTPEVATPGALHAKVEALTTQIPCK